MQQFWKSIHNKLALVSVLAIVAGCATNLPSQDINTTVPDEPVATGQSTAPEKSPLPEKSPPRPPVLVSRIAPSPAVSKVIAQAISARNDGRYDYAMLLLDRAQRMAPKTGEVYLEMARVSRQTGQLAKAEQLCLKAISLSGQDQGFRRMAMRELAFIRKSRPRSS